MKNITVNKGELREIIQENRQGHRAIFEAAQIMYRERLIEELDRRLADAHAGRQIDQFIRLPVPEDHTDDYDRVLRMLELDVSTTIELTEADVKMYVQDDWAWNASFAANTMSYTSYENS